MKLGLKTNNLKQLTIKENPSASIKTHQFSVDASGTKKKILTYDVCSNSDNSP